MTTWHDARDKMVYKLDRARNATADEELREWFNQTALDLCAGRTVRNLDEALLAAQRELDAASAPAARWLR